MGRDLRPYGDTNVIAITCEKCRRRFTPTVNDMETALSASQGKKHAQVLCPHCGKANKVAPQRLREALRFSPRPAPAAPPAADAPADGGE